MTREEAKQYWQFRLDNAKDYIDPHWEADERRAHREYVEALTAAVEALSAEAEETVLNKMLEEEMIVLPQDYIKVVRCKDCCHRVHDEERSLYYCERYYGQGDVSDENFCQWGERSE